MAGVDARVTSHGRGRPEDRCAAGPGGTAADVSFSVTICPHCAALLLPSTKSEPRIKIKMPQHLCTVVSAFSAAATISFPFLRRPQL